MLPSKTPIAWFVRAAGVAMARASRSREAAYSARPPPRRRRQLIADHLPRLGDPPPHQPVRRVIRHRERQIRRTDSLHSRAAQYARTHAPALRTHLRPAYRKNPSGTTSTGRRVPSTTGPQVSVEQRTAGTATPARRAASSSNCAALPSSAIAVLRRRIAHVRCQRHISRVNANSTLSR